MNILLLTPYSPYPPNSGGRIRLWEQIRYLGPRHALTLVAFYQTEQEFQARAAFESYCRAAHLVARPAHPLPSDLEQLQSLPDLFRWYTSPDMARVLEALRGQAFDRVILHHIFMAQYRECISAPAVLEEQNIESDLFRQHAQLEPRGSREHIFRQTRWMLLKQYENEMWPHFPLRVTVSDADRLEIERRCAVGRTIVVENGVRAAEAQPLPAAHSRQILFMGSLDFYPNIDAILYFCHSILPHIWAKDPTVTLVIAGRRPPAAVHALAGDPRILVVANPPDMTELLRASALTIAPLRIGSGTRVKILQSLAIGRPVVTTSIGCAGLDLLPEHDLCVRNDPAAFADSVLEVLDDPALAARLTENGRRAVETHYEWSQLLQRYERELIELAPPQ